MLMECFHSGLWEGCSCPGWTLESILFATFWWFFPWSWVIFADGCANQVSAEHRGWGDSEDLWGSLNAVQSFPLFYPGNSGPSASLSSQLLSSQLRGPLGSPGRGLGKHRAHLFFLLSQDYCLVLLLILCLSPVKSVFPPSFLVVYALTWTVGKTLVESLEKIFGVLNIVFITWHCLKTETNRKKLGR